MIPGLAALHRRWADHPAEVIQPREHDGLGRVRVGRECLIGLHQQAELLSLRAARIRSLTSGSYLSPFKGRGMEFDELRPYQRGDDPRNIDWRVMARSGKPHTKLFREERDRSVILWVDLRRPMFFASRGRFKAVQAARSAALLAWSALGHGDRLGGLVFSDTDHRELRPKRGKGAVMGMVAALADHPAWDAQGPGQEGSADQALARLRRVARPGSLIFLLSDFRHLGEAGRSHLQQLARHNDLVLCFFHDPLERELPPTGLYRVSDGTRDYLLDSGRQNLRATYHQAFEAHRQWLTALGHGGGVHLINCSTEEEPLAALQAGLGQRRR